MCANESIQLRQLDPSYIKTIIKNNPQQLQQLIDEKQIENQNGVYFATSSCSLSESFFVKGADKRTVTQSVDGVEQDKPIKGLGVEHTSNPNQDKNVVSKESVTTFKIDDLMAQAGLDSSKKAALKKAFIDAGIKVDENGNVSYAEQAKFDTAYAKFAEANRMTYITLDGDTDGTIRQDLIDKNAIVEDGEQLVVKDTKQVEDALPIRDEKPVTTRTDSAVSINADVTTTTVEKQGPDVPDNLRNSRANRKKAKENFTNALESWANKKDNEEVMNYSIVRNQHKRAFRKEMKNLRKEINDPTKLLDKYMNTVASKEQRKAYESAYQEFIGDKSINTPEETKAKEAKLLNAYNDFYHPDGTGKLKDLHSQYISDDTLRKHAFDALFMSDIYKEGGATYDSMMEEIATKKVLDSRSNEEIEKDKKAFIKDEAKRQVKAAQAKQDVANTRLYFSKDARKKAEKNSADPNLIHNDIGKYGRKLVMACPKIFCDEVTAQDYDFESNGKYYKFSQDKFNAFCADAVDSKRSAGVQSKFGEDNNLTLNESREFMYTKLETADGSIKTLEEIIGNDNGKIGNRELNRLRHMVEDAGYSIDRNKTAAKRALHVAKDAAIGAATGFVGGYLGSKLAGAVVGTTASQLVGYTGYTDPSQYNYSTNVQFDINGEIYQQNVNGTVNVPSQKVEGETKAPGQKYRDDRNLRAGGSAAGLGAISGGIAGLFTMGKINAKGRDFDGIVDLSKDVKNEDTESTVLKLNVPKFVTTEKRSFEKEEPSKEIVNYKYKIKVKRYKEGWNKAEDRLSIVKKMYSINDETTAQKVLDYIMTKVNGYKKNPHKTNYAANLTYYFPQEIPAGTIYGIESSFTGKDPTTLKDYNWNYIELGNSNGKNGHESHLIKEGTKRKVSATITTK